MPAFFLDSNIIIKYYVEEPGSDWVRALIDDPDNLCLISEVSVVEVAAALSQLRRDRRFGRTRMLNIFARFEENLHQGLFLSQSLDVTVLDRAAEVALTHVVKGYDAIQVASAAIVEESANFQVVFVSGDKQALRTAQFEALEVDNPFDHVSGEEAGSEE